MTDVATAPDQRSWRCTNCNRPLSDAQAVCVHCEPEFAETLRFRVRERLHLPPLHHCPACQEGFDVPDTNNKPDNVPLWKLVSPGWRCPKCGVDLEWVPNPKMALAMSCAQIGLLGWIGSSIMFGGIQSIPKGSGLSVIKLIFYAVGALNVAACVWAASVQDRRRPRPTAEVNYWQPATLRQANELAPGSFLMRPRKQSLSTPRPAWALAVVLLASYLGIGWGAAEGHFANHPDIPLGAMVLTTVVIYGAVFHAWRLRRQARAEALQAQVSQP